jgi:predicted Zn-dependent protease
VPVIAGHAFAVVGRDARTDDVLARARRWLDAAGRSNHPPVSVLLDAGAVDEAGGDLRGAATALDAALRRDPANPEILLLRGVVAARQEDWPGAEAAFRSAARSAPKSPEPWDDLARVYALTGRPQQQKSAAARADQLRG